MNHYATLELRSQNEHPGNDILSNRDQFKIKIETPLSTKFDRKKCRASYIYLFICPIFGYNDAPFTTLPITAAPFCVETPFLKTKPAYMVYKGKVHLGIQIQKIPMEIDILIRLAVRTPQYLQQRYRYELAQIILFDNTGSFVPLNVKTIVIYHNPKDLVIINTGEPPRPQLMYPLPYFQSPLLQISGETDPIVNPTIIKLGDPNYIYSGLHDFFPYQKSSIIGEYFAFPPQLSYPAKAHLFALLQTDTDYWFKDSLVQMLASNPEKFLHSMQETQYTTQGTQTNTPTQTTTIDAVCQTENKEEAELQAILDDLFSTLPPSPTTGLLQVY